MLTRASKLVSAVTSFPVQYNKAIVGRNAFAHESGIHQDGMLKNTQTYEIMTPESVGVSKTSLVMGKHSGRHAFREKLKRWATSWARTRWKMRSSASRIWPTARRSFTTRTSRRWSMTRSATRTERIKVVSLMVVAGTIRSAIGDVDTGHRRQAKHGQATGNGPVDALFNAIQALVPHDAKLELYQVHAVTEGTDAQAEVSVRLEENGRRYTGRAAHPDTLVASAKAYVAALNKLEAKRDRLHAQYDAAE